MKVTNVLFIFLFTMTLKLFNLSSYSIELDKHTRMRTFENKLDYTIFKLNVEEYPKDTFVKITISRSNMDYSYPIVTYKGYIDKKRKVFAVKQWGFGNSKADNQILDPLLIIFPNISLGEKITCQMSEWFSGLNEVSSSITPYPIKKTNIQGHELSLVTITLNEIESYDLEGEGFPPYEDIKINITGDYYNNNQEEEEAIVSATFDGKFSYHIEKFKNILGDQTVHIELSGRKVNMSMSPFFELIGLSE